MAKIVRYIEDVSKITANDFLIELEEIEFIDDRDKSKSFTISSITPISTEKCTEIENTVYWNKRNFHLIVSPGEVK